MTHRDRLLEKIEKREAVVGVVGLGYVGLPLALLFAEGGFSVVGFDVDGEKVARLLNGDSYIRHIGPRRVAKAVASGKLKPTSDFDRIGECDAVIICVPTPLGSHREPDLSFVRATAAEIGKRLAPGRLVVLESTSYPGTTREEVLPSLARPDFVCGRDFFLAFSPEREDPGNKKFSTRTIPKLVGGLDPDSRDVAVALYGSVVDQVVPVSSAEVAEAAKLLENVFRSVNIALVNELKTLFDRMDIDVWEVIAAAATKPFGFMPFQPGPGLGGHCIPLDPFYLSWKAAEKGLFVRFVELAGEINASMPRYVVARAAEALNRRGMPLSGSRILVLGLSYKPDIDDDRESPSFEILRLLRDAGAETAYCDPHIPATHSGRKHKLALTSVPCTAEEFARHDLLVIATAHTAFRDATLFSGARGIVDTRNLTRGMELSAEVIRA